MVAQLLTVGTKLTFGHYFYETAAVIMLKMFRKSSNFTVYWSQTSYSH
jgi:hypothetical protein